MSPKTIAVVGAPSDLGQPFHGVMQAPDLIRKGGLFDLFTEKKIQFRDAGNLSVPEGPTNFRKIGSFCASLALQTHFAAIRGEFCITLGGDHSIALGSIAGMLKAYPDLGVVWVD